MHFLSLTLYSFFIKLLTHKETHSSEANTFDHLFSVIYITATMQLFSSSADFFFFNKVTTDS